MDWFDGTQLELSFGDDRASEVERWLPLKRCEGYDVSDWGRVRSYWTRKGAGKGAWRLGDEPKLMLTSVQTNGRVYATLRTWRDGKRVLISVQVHTLVLETFVGPCPEGMEACHDPDPDPTNNHLMNLRWDTHLNNMRDRLKHHDGVYSPRSQLTPDDIPVIWGRIVAGEQGSLIARDYNVHYKVIDDIKRRRNWKHITDALPGVPKYREAGRGVEEKDIPAIWARLVAGEMMKVIARDYGVSEQVILHIKWGRTWGNITSKLPGQPQFRKLKKGRIDDPE
jgi:hypothetical protein